MEWAGCGTNPFSPGDHLVQQCRALQSRNFSSEIRVDTKHKRWCTKGEVLKGKGDSLWLVLYFCRVSPEYKNPSPQRACKARVQWNWSRIFKCSFKISGRTIVISAELIMLSAIQSAIFPVILVTINVMTECPNVIIFSFTSLYYGSTDYPDFFVRVASFKNSL